MIVVRSLLTAALLVSAAPLAAAAAAELPHPALLVVNKSEATLAIVDPATGRIVAKVATGEGPHEVETDGTRAFVTNYGTAQAPGNSVSIIDLASLKEVKRIDLGAIRRPHGIVLADGRLYFTAEANRLVGRFDPATGLVDWVMGTGQAGTHMVWVHKTGTPVVTTNIGSDTVTVIERGTNPTAWTVTQVATGKGPEGFDVSPDGLELWAAHSRDGGVSIVDLAGKTVKQTIDLKTKRSNRLKFTPDGRLVLISDLDTGDLVVVDAKSRTEVKRVPLGRAPSGILVVPDGSRAYVALTGDNQLAVVDLQTFAVTATIALGAAPDGMAWIK
jgi:YVTN family beta-propeller protein